MYEEFYGFREKPFEIVPNPHYLYRSLKHDKALTYLEYGLSENLGFILLTGEIGSGKTTLIQYILTQLEADTEAAVIFNTNVNGDQLLNMILSEFELPQQENKAEMLNILNHFLIQKYADHKKVLLIIDEAQNLSGEALEEVRMLSNLQSDNHILLQIMLVGQPELKARLHDPSMRQFAQRIAVNYHLTGLNLEETSKYIAHRLQIAGGSPQLFTPKAAEYIYKLSAGIPRSVNIACQAALVYGYADESQRITQDIVRQIINDKVGISLDIFGKKDAEKAVEKAHLKPSNGIQRHLENLESEIRDIKNLVSAGVNGSRGSAKKPRDELVERLIAMLDVERRRNHDLAKQIGTLEVKITAALSARKKLEKYIYHIRNTERVGQVSQNLS
jgi:general secretion pathway protein A